MAVMEALSMEVAKIHPSPDNIRHRIGRLTELKQSMEAVGLLQPIVVVENTEGYAIVAGHRRFAAALELGWTEIDVVVRDFDDAEKIEAMIVENFHREDLSPIEQAEGLFALAALGITQKEIAEKTGLSSKLVRERIKLLDLPKVGQDLIHKGQLSIEAGLDLVKAESDTDLLTEVLESVAAGESSNLRWVLDQKRAEREAAASTEIIGEKVEKLRELGLAVVEAELSTDRYTYGNAYQSHPRSWSEVVAPDDHSSWRTDRVAVNVKAHAKEECAVWYFTPANGRYAAGLVQLCRKPSRHTFAGDSELKVPKAEETADEKKKASAARKKEREQRAEFDARYRAALAKKPPKALMFEVAWRGMAKEIWAEHRKRACILLGLEPVEKKGQPKDYDTPFREFAEANPEKAILALYLAVDDPLDAKQYRPVTYQAVADSLVALIPETAE